MTRWNSLLAVFLFSSQFFFAQYPAKNDEATYEQYREAAIRINDLAQQIYSEGDAVGLVSEIEVVFGQKLPPAWFVRVAHAEYESVRDPAKLVSEQHLVDVWNQYVREIGAADEALVTVAEIHNLRDAEHTAAQLLWAWGSQTIWTVPNVYAVGTDGKIAEGCRAVEAIRVIYDLEQFRNLSGARDRMRRGIVASQQDTQYVTPPSSLPPLSFRLEARLDADPVRLAEQRYIQAHGSTAYEQLLKRFFDELFPSE